MNHYIIFIGTKLEALTQQISKNNTSGVKGVCRKTIKGRIYWEASIQLSKKRYYKMFKNKEEAILWRKRKEEELYEPLLRK